MTRSADLAGAGVSRARRGVAMLAALWLVVGITIVALDFALAARERRELGIAAADRARASAAALGAFALTRAQLEYALRVRPQGAAGTVGRLRSSDPWLGADSIWSGVQIVDRLPVTVEAADLGAKLNVNALSETEWRTFFSYLLGDYVRSDELAQAISDWRDADDIARVKGGERDDYIKAGLLRVPANQDFRDLEELLDVKGMTPEIYALVSPYLTTIGAAQVNLNAAPVPVLRVLPGMTDEIISRILQLRARGSRITSVAEVMPQARGGVSDRVAAAVRVRSLNAEAQMSARAGVLTQQVELTMFAQASPAAKPVRLRVVVARATINGQPMAGVLNEEWR